MTPFPSNLTLSRRRDKNRTVIHFSFPFIFISYYLVTISTHFKDYVLVSVYLSDIRKSSMGLHFVHTMLTDVGEQYNHDLIHMVIFYMIQTFSRAAQNPATQNNYAIKIHLQGASLVAQWLRVCLPVQGTRVRALVWGGTTCRGAAGPVGHNC